MTTKTISEDLKLTDDSDLLFRGYDTQIVVQGQPRWFRYCHPHDVCFPYGNKSAEDIIVMLEMLERKGVAAHFAAFYARLLYRLDEMELPKSLTGLSIRIGVERRDLLTRLRALREYGLLQVVEVRGRGSMLGFMHWSDIDKISKFERVREIEKVMPDPEVDDEAV